MTPAVGAQARTPKTNPTIPTARDRRSRAEYSCSAVHSPGVYSAEPPQTHPIQTPWEDIREEKQKRDKKPLLKTKASTYAPLLAAVIQLLLIIASRISISSLRERGNIYLSVVVIQLLIYVLPGIFYFKLRREGLDRPSRSEAHAARPRLYSGACGTAAVSDIHRL